MLPYSQKWQEYPAHLPAPPLLSLRASIRLNRKRHSDTKLIVHCEKSGEMVWSDSKDATNFSHFQVSSAGQKWCHQAGLRTQQTLQHTHDELLPISHKVLQFYLRENQYIQSACLWWDTRIEHEQFCQKPKVYKQEQTRFCSLAKQNCICDFCWTLWWYRSSIAHVFSVGYSLIMWCLGCTHCTNKTH